jgi:hypothetical protein
MKHTPLWKVRSGKWAGWNMDGSIFNTEGKNIGHAIENRIFSLDGKCIGEMFDDRYVGLRDGVTYPEAGRCAPYAPVIVMKCQDISGVNTTTWADPDF